MCPHKTLPGRRAARPLAQRQRQHQRRMRRAARESYELRLYVAGTGPLSALAVKNLNTLCEARLAGRYHLEVIDIHQQPEAVSEASVIAAPTLIKTLPLPARRYIGNLASAETVLRRLNMIANPVKTRV